jgi:hypothetical protein
MDVADLGREVLALHDEYTTSGTQVCLLCGNVFTREGESAASCSYHNGDYVALADSDDAATGYFSCCQSRDEIFWGGAPLYGSLIPLVPAPSPSLLYPSVA